MLLDENGCLNEDAQNKLREYADLLDCECPHHLLAILDQLRSFRAYTVNCVVRFPKDAATHQWLAASALNLDKMLSGTIIQLARMEGFVDESNQLVARNTLSR